MIELDGNAIALDNKPTKIQGWGTESFTTNVHTKTKYFPWLQPSDGDLICCFVLTVCLRQIKVMIKCKIFQLENIHVANTDQ